MSPCSISARSALRGNTLTDRLLSGGGNRTHDLRPERPYLSVCGLEAAEGSHALKTSEANRLGKWPVTPRTAGAISLWGQPETPPSVRLLFGLLTPGRDFRD